MDGIKRTSQRGVTVKHASSVNHRTVQKSTTLNRKFVKKPVAKPRVNANAANVSSRENVVVRRAAAPMINKKHSVHLAPVTVKEAAPSVVKKQATTTAEAAARVIAERKFEAEAPALETVVKPEMLNITNARIAAQKAEAPVLITAQERKERAIQDALRKVAATDDNAKLEGLSEAKQHNHKRLAIVSAMAVIAFALVGYLVYLNMPDISMRVAAMQTGIENAFPNYVPSGYRLDGTVKEHDGRITMSFKNASGSKFLLMEEKSSWDTSALLANYVEKEWGQDYTVARGQGLTIFISGSNAAWVNGGVFYLISDVDGVLTASDLHDIAVSL